MSMEKDFDKLREGTRMNQQKQVKRITEMLKTDLIDLSLRNNEELRHAIASYLVDHPDTPVRTKDGFEVRYNKTTLNYAIKPIDYTSKEEEK